MSHILAVAALAASLAAATLVPAASASQSMAATGGFTLTAFNELLPLTRGEASPRASPPPLSGCLGRLDTAPDCRHRAAGRIVGEESGSAAHLPGLIARERLAARPVTRDEPPGLLAASIRT